MLEKNGAIEEEKPTPPESPAGEKTTPSVSEDEQTQEEELNSGIENFDNRFKEVYRNWKEAERKLEGTKEVKPTPEEPEEPPATMNELYEKVEKRLENKAQLKEKEISNAMTVVNRDIAYLKTVDPELDEEKLWEYMEKNKTLNVLEAYTKGVSLNNESKKLANKIGSNEKNATGKAEMSYEQLRNTDWDDIQLPI